MERLANEQDWGAWCEIPKELIKNCVIEFFKNTNGHFGLHFMYTISTIDGSKNTRGFHAIDFPMYGAALLNIQCFWKTSSKCRTA